MQINLTRKNGDGPIEKMVLQPTTPESSKLLEEVLTAIQAPVPQADKVVEVLKKEPAEIRTAPPQKRETSAQAPDVPKRETIAGAKPNVP